MNKSLLRKQILTALETARQRAVDAAQQAYNTATHEENVAENKYDTLGLEAAYLAHGQSLRVTECEADLAAFKKLADPTCSHQTPIVVGTLIYLKDDCNVEQYLFLGPAAGGLKLTFCQKDIIIITPTAPLGQALIGRFVDDEIEITVGGQKKYYEITAVY